MIILYYGISSRTSRQAAAWFEDYKIKIIKKKIAHMTRADLVHILSLSENGFSDILKKSKGTGTRIYKIAQNVKCSSFNEAVDCLLENPDMLKVPIIFDENRLVIGYNSESIRTYITKEYRKSIRGKII